MSERLFALLFPEVPRTFPGRRGLKILLRAAHVLCVGVFVGAHVLGAAVPDQGAWLHATILSGLSILLLDLHESAVFLLQVRGLVVVMKLVVLAALPWFGRYQARVLCLLVIVSVISSHAPSRWRYRVLLGGARLQGGRARG